jgi:DNA-binding PadR family transcriptional regulator
MTSRRLRNPLAVVVLGMLAEEPLHPYGMRQRANERAYDRMPGVRVSSLYDTVARLASAGLLDADEAIRAGNRPERTRYRITPAGLNSLTAWVEATLADDGDADGLAAALAFMYSVGRNRVVDLLRGRADRLGAALDTDEDELARSARDDAAPIFLSEHRYLLARRRAERDWITEFVVSLQNGDLSWPE